MRLERAQSPSRSPGRGRVGLNIRPLLWRALWRARARRQAIPAPDRPPAIERRLPPPQLGEGVAADRRQPALAVRAGLERVPVPVRAEVGLLDEVFRVCRIAGEGGRDARDRRQAAAAPSPRTLRSRFAPRRSRSCASASVSFRDRERCRLERGDARRSWNRRGTPRSAPRRRHRSRRADRAPSGRRAPDRAGSSAASPARGRRDRCGATSRARSASVTPQARDDQHDLVQRAGDESAAAFRRERADPSAAATIRTPRSSAR